MGLDSDEGVRIENCEDGRKIFINRNLVGTYNILVRTKNKSVNSDKGKGKDNEKNDKGYFEQVFNFNEVALVLEFVKEKVDKFNIWLY